ncbi:hypothetical protein [Streptosporangium carneum]|uniref:Uncharacterized protein n=1 Tax=Streptosporangium carneum TaxID=47481 RepID=A0A9W6I2T9_9ACTN|nr:hypothetical protein [Streptosporangium carneum]GLK10653.1 hypothetical protein GCM10017600_40590 [Streptosporangium carneum]
MWFLDRTARQLRLSPALLTPRPIDLSRLESLLRQYDPGLTVSGDWFTARGTRLRRAVISEEQAALARVPLGMRGAVIARGGGKAARRLLLAGLASRLGGTLHPVEEHEALDDHVDLEVRLDAHLSLDCEKVAQMVRPILGERTVDHDHDLRVCRIEGRKGDPILVTYEYPPARRPGASPPGLPARDSGHVVGLEIDARDPHRSDMEVLYRAALAVSSATGGGLYSMDFPVTRFEDILPAGARTEV